MISALFREQSRNQIFFFDWDSVFFHFLPEPVQAFDTGRQVLRTIDHCNIRMPEGHEVIHNLAYPAHIINHQIVVFLYPAGLPVDHNDGNAHVAEYVDILIILSLIHIFRSYAFVPVASE